MYKNNFAAYFSLKRNISSIASNCSFESNYYLTKEIKKTGDEEYGIGE